MPKPPKSRPVQTSLMLCLRPTIEPPPAVRAEVVPLLSDLLWQAAVCLAATQQLEVRSEER